MGGKPRTYKCKGPDDYVKVKLRVRDLKSLVGGSVPLHVMACAHQRLEELGIICPDFMGIALSRKNKP